jgi:hypothetical protein
MIDRIGIPDALRKYYPNTTWRFEGNDDLNYDGLIWQDDEIEAPSEETLLEKVEVLRTEYINTQYSRDRASAYPSIKDQLDTLYHQGYDGWKAMIDEIKNKYPKPEEN